MTMSLLKIRFYPSLLLFLGIIISQAVRAHDGNKVRIDTELRQTVSVKLKEFFIPEFGPKKRLDEHEQKGCIHYSNNQITFRSDGSTPFIIALAIIYDEIRAMLDFQFSPEVKFTMVIISLIFFLGLNELGI